MSFVSIAFIIFLPITFLLYWLMAQRPRWQNQFMVLVSYIFYGWWDWRFLLLIAITSFCSYFTGLAIDATNVQKRKQYWVAVNIIVNLGILAFFKYFNFFIISFCQLAQSLSFSASPDSLLLKLVLPVGISFYTFQSLSYTIDVYRGRIQATHNITAFFAYISFFPQLVAGPIERATNLLPQILRPRPFNQSLAIDGLRRILWGYVKKIVIADNCALAVNTVWLQWETTDCLTLIVGAILFSFQLYGDFSGYSDIAIGTAQLFGIRLSNNFNYPYLARSMAEFWHRWHISLMTWFRDYLYIPLGGSRGTRFQTIRNTLIVFFLSGLWHGANWTYVLWGLFNAICLIPSIFTSRSQRKRKEQAEIRIADLPRMLLTFSLFTVSLIFFRAPNVYDAIGYIVRMSSLQDFTLSLSVGKQALIASFLLMAIEWKQRHLSHALQLSSSSFFNAPWKRWMVYYALLLIILFFHGEQQTFIYFQF